MMVSRFEDRPHLPVVELAELPDLRPRVASALDVVAIHAAGMRARQEPAQDEA